MPGSFNMPNDGLNQADTLLRTTQAASASACRRRQSAPNGRELLKLNQKYSIGA
jgi:hypothetical protein